MPLFVTPEMEHAWVLDDLSDDDMTEIFNYSISSDAIDHRPVFFYSRWEKSSPKEKNGTLITTGVISCAITVRKIPDRNKLSLLACMGVFSWVF